MPKPAVYQDERVESVQAPKVDFLGIQRPPFDHTPDGLEFKKPESYDGEEDQAGEQGQPQQI